MREYTKMLKDAGQYQPERQKQVFISGCLELAIKNILAYQGEPDYTPFVADSRGKVAPHPAEVLLLKYLDTFQASLKALGLNCDSRMARPTDDQGDLGDFLEKFKED